MPISAFRLLKSRFVGAQPIVLNASVTPTAWPSDFVALLTVASIAEVFCASSVMSPVLVLTVALVRYALAFESTVLVAITALTASADPAPNVLPPEACAVLSARARITASSSAVNVTEAAFTVALLA